MNGHAKLVIIAVQRRALWIIFLILRISIVPQFSAF